MWFASMAVMGFRRASLAALMGVLLLSGPAIAAAGADWARVLRDHEAAERELRPSPRVRDNGDYLDRNGEALTAAYLKARHGIYGETAARLDAIDRGALSPTDALSYDIFRWNIADGLDEFASGAAERDRLLPLNQFNGAQITFARQMQWRPGTAFERPADFDEAIRRMLGFTRWLDQAVANMREGAGLGITQPRAVVERIIAQTEIFAKPDDGGFFMEQARHIPDSFSAEEKTRIEISYREAVEGALVPAYRRLAAFLKTEYLPKARALPGLLAIPGGREMYLHLVKSETTASLTPEEIHALGLAEIARIEAEMEQVKRDAKFTGTLKAFREFLRTDPRFQYKDEAAMSAEFGRIKQIVIDNIGAVFSRLPGGRLTFGFYEPYMAPDKPAAEFTPGGQGRPGIVYLNSHDLPSRRSYTSEALEAHEGIPGHHLQTSFAAENRSLPRFRRFGAPAAYTEGWALYAEKLGPELGLYRDPYQKFGALTFEAWRASRLVVDTGIHWLGWPREKAIAFLVEHAFLPEAEAAEEADRYAVLPAQALSYKIGERAILSLRERTKAALGARFDIRRFHDAILKEGGMPLEILSAKIERWIETEKSGS
jgi:uncharacterized protein (DUF885 family)